jgi:hypothetical protein
MSTFWQNLAEGILLAVVRDEYPCCVVNEMVEIEEVHLVLHKQRRQWLQGLRYPYLDWFGVITTLTKSHVFGLRLCFCEGKVIVQLCGRDRRAEDSYRRVISISGGVKVW